MKNIYIHSRIFQLFTGTYGLLISLYLLLNADNCRQLLCGLFHDSAKTLAIVLLFGAIANLLTANIKKIPKFISFPISLFSAFSYILISAAVLGHQDPFRFSVFSVIAAFLLAVPFLPKNPFANKELHLFPVFIGVILTVLSIILFLNKSFLLPLFVFPSGLVYLISSLKDPYKNHPIRTLFVIISLSLLLFHALSVNSLFLVIFFCLSGLFIFGFYLLKKRYTLKTLSKPKTVFQKLANNLESVYWIGSALIILITITSLTSEPNTELIYITLGFTSIFGVFFFHLPPESFFTEKIFPPSLALFQIFALIIISLSGSLKSPFISFLPILIFIPALYLKTKYLLPPVLINIGYFFGVFIASSSRSTENFFWFLLDSAVLTLIAVILYQTVKIKQTYGKPI